MPSTLGIVASGEDVFNDAVLWLDTARSVANETTMVNYGKGGSALNATYGSSAGADTNDPLLLVHTGTNYLYLPGVIGNGSQVPDEAALDITGDIEIIRRVAMDDWTPAGNQCLAGKFGGAGNRSWRFYVNGAGQPVFETSPDGTTLLASTATASLGGADGQALWVRVVFDADDGAGNRVATFYKAADSVAVPTSWTQVGAAVTTAGATSIFNSTDPIVIGARGAGAASEAMAGIDYRCIVKATPLGTPTTVLDVDFTTGITSGGQTSFTASTGQTVTINRSTSGRKSVAVVRNVLLFGTDDYLEIADNDLLDFGASDSFTVMWVGRQWATLNNNKALVSKRASYFTATDPGWSLAVATADHNVIIGDGTTQRAAGRAVAGAGVLGTVIGVASVNGTSTTYVNGVAGTTVGTVVSGSLANALPLTVGKIAGVGSFSDFECLAVALWRRRLTTNEIATAVARYA